MRHARQFAAFAFAFLACAGASATVVATNTSYGVIDGTLDTRRLTVAEHGWITDLNILVEFSKCDDPPIGPNGSACRGPSDPFEEEIAFTLTGPDGRSVDLVLPYETYTGATRGAGRVSVNFDDEAPDAVGPRIAAGTFRPEGRLGLFDRTDMFGDWTLSLQDFSPGDPLEFFSASLDISFTTGPAPVPEPATLAMLGLGLLGMRAVRRR